MSRSKVLATLLAVLTTITALAGFPTSAAAATTSVTLVGSLQSELGCPDDWDPACPATMLTSTGSGSWTGEFRVPAGSYEFKVALNGS